MPLKCALGDSLLVIYGKKRRTHLAHPDKPQVPVCAHVRAFEYAGSYGAVTAVDESNVLTGMVIMPPKNLVECVDCALSYRAALMLSALPDERKQALLASTRELVGKENLLKKLTEMGVFKP